MSRLSALQEREGQAKDALSAYTAELESIVNGTEEPKVEGRAFTPDEDQKLKDLEAHLSQRRGLKTMAETEEREATEEAESRAKLLGSSAAAVEGQVRVNGADLIYGPANPENSFYRDLLTRSNTNDRGWQEAFNRLQAHQEQMDNVFRSSPGSPEGRAIRKYDAESARRRSDTESRAVSTGTASMGDLAPPLYFLTEWAAWRTYGRTLIDALRSFPMPETGMVFNVPQITQPTLAANQTTATQGAGDNQSVSNRDMTSTYQNGTLQTVIDNLNVSQQYLDRVGPGIAGDQIVRDDQQRQVNRLLNLYAWQALFATPGVGTTAYTDTSFSAPKYLQAMRKAKAAIQKTDGVVTYPTHFFTDVDVWETVEGAYDSNNRPLVVPQGVAYNPLAVGDSSDVPEGYTGFRFGSLPAFKDQATWVQWQASGASPTYHVSLVAALDIAAVWLEGTPVTRVVAQPGAATLTVLLQEYVYAAFVPIYPGAMNLLYGTGTTDSYLTA